ncbi:hypothetical protein PV783_11585 [Chitinophaga sp. CC14]|uniref:hypothetical protein n=1 Tax=Chitinophaga sp. CC14 TaxID=3029199 RepID=UPI003B7C1C46
MRKLDTSAVSGTVGLPLKAGSLVHIQLAYQEALSALGKALAGSAYDPTKMYVLNGCVNSGSGNNYNISAGSVFYNGEMYLVDAAVFSVSGANVAVGIVPNPPGNTIGLSFFSDVTADPVQFTDGIDRNVHQIRKCVIQAGLSGSGAANYLDWIDITKRLQGSIGQITMWKWPAGDLYSKYFDANGAGIHPYTIGWHDMNGLGNTIDMRGRIPVGWTPADPDFNAPFNNVGGSKTHQNTIEEMAPHSHTLNIPKLQANADSSGTPDYVAIEAGETGITGGGEVYSIMNPYRSVLWVQRVA